MSAMSTSRSRALGLLKILRNRLRTSTSCAELVRRYSCISRHALSKVMQSTKERVVVSVGGSLIVPDQIDTDFLKRFKALILDKVEKGFTFSIIAGGGKTARRYQDAANIVTPLSRQDTDWIGIHATRLNAQLLRNIFVGYAHQHVVKNPTKDIDGDEPVIIAAGWKPG